MRTYFYAAVLSLFAMSCATGNEEKKLPLVDVELCKPVEMIKGKIWPRRDDGMLLSAAAVETPTQVTVRFPGGRTYSSYSKMVTMDEERGLVRQVSVYPFSSPMKHDKSVDVLVDIAADIERLFKISAKCSVVKEIGDWKTNRPAGPTRGTFIQVEDRVQLMIRLVAINEKEDRWMGYLIFTYKEPVKK